MQSCFDAKSGTAEQGEKLNESDEGSICCVLEVGLEGVSCPDPFLDIFLYVYMAGVCQRIPAEGVGGASW